MNKDHFSYNPNLQTKDSLSYFRKSLNAQDEVPIIFAKDKDSLFYRNQIIQVSVDKGVQYEKSLFPQHLLKAKPPYENKAAAPISDWSTIVLMLCFMFFAGIQYNYFKRVQQLFKAFAVARFFSQLARESNLFKERATVLLFSMYVVVLSFFLTMTSLYYSGNKDELGGLLLFLKVLAGVIVFYFLKIILFSFTGRLFKSSKEAADYILSIYVFGQVMGIVLLPFSVVLTYFPSEFVLILFFVIFGISYFYRAIRGMIFIYSGLNAPAYYLFLYLCTLEILPLVIIAKYIMLILS
jgi:hypothetical protein